MATKKSPKHISKQEASRREQAAFFRGHKEGCRFTLERIHNALELDTYFERKPK